MSDRCPCGGVIYADTEDNKMPLCYECYMEIMKALEKVRKIIGSDEIIEMTKMLDKDWNNE